jgi:hypothetical protein
VLQSATKLSLEVAAVLPLLETLPMVEIFTPIAHILVAVSVRECALSARFVVEPISLIYVPVSVYHSPVSVCFVVLEVTNVLRAIWPNIYSPPVADS